MMRHCGWLATIFLLPLLSFNIYTSANNIPSGHLTAPSWANPCLLTNTATSGLNYLVMNAPENIEATIGGDLYRVRLLPGSMDADKVFLLIDKTDYRLYVYEDVTLRKIYKVTFGNSDLTDKQMQGDRRTPEGVFHISNKRMDARWSRFMLLDYPNETSWTRFHDRQSRGVIPANATIGDGVGIHGVEEAAGINDQYVEQRINWTLGCISLKSADIAELYNVLKVGTPVVIRR
ncbi:L,D-transpeptidase catalytic domain [Chitinophaga costaii]|uniref:L,D-transpeptidase catalytic domain n=1 Tax=Chitinophaga costaii TaxID=1335309 RepID=A0A1C4FT35_9BACT|nr:L,D-transpeptidase [Chitinophaga costaii]PUZ20509.1 hypothetical protein DCM91_18935 [Chitinophaga costaii]SCC58783.1 L,D-transpeptidase catalytic domain [Chitinophaga costaii]